MLRVISTALPGVLVIEPEIHRDARGIVIETFHVAKYRKHGLPETFLQDIHSVSRVRTLRGLHLQRLLRAVSDAIAPGRAAGQFAGG